jgi:hypothetical protein
MSKILAALLLSSMFLVRPAFCQAGEAAPVIVPPPVAPRSVTVPPERLQPPPQIGPPVTVPEGEPLPQLPPPPRAPVVDPSIQRETSPQARPGPLSGMKWQSCCRSPRSTSPGSTRIQIDRTPACIQGRIYEFTLL